MQTKAIISHISNWLINYIEKSKKKGFVVGISGGIDSAITSTLIAKNNIPLLCLEMPIHQKKEQVNRGTKHIKWLKDNFKNVESENIDLTCVFDNFINHIGKTTNNNQLSLANTRARLRMTTLYYFAGNNNYLVAGTGNKVEDFGIGFFTKYGDGGVDINPIADLLKTEVYTIGKELGIIDDILTAAPTDGLWKEEKTDEEQIGATYPELEWAMHFKGDYRTLTTREKEVLRIYTMLNSANQHKMTPIPTCIIPKKMK